MGGWNRGLHKETEAILMANIQKDEKTGCWNWLKSTEHGYGQVWDYKFKRPRHAHRVAARIWLDFPDDDPKRFVLHKCDNRLCINPSHLYIGSGADNARDREERNPDHARSHKLTATKVNCIRVCAEVGATQREIAEWFGVSRYNIRAIVARETWKRLPSFQVAVNGFAEVGE